MSQLGVTFSPAYASQALASVVAGAVAYPITAGTGIYNLPKANTRQLVIYNNGANTIYFGFHPALVYAKLPPPWNPAGAAIVATVGATVQILPVGASFSLDLETYEHRGNFDPQDPVVTSAQFVPTTILFFASAGVDASAVVSYYNSYGSF
jgi:hypothetical protein